MEKDFYMDLWQTEYKGVKISVTNTLTTVKLWVDGKTQDLYWGLAASHI